MGHYTHSENLKFQWPQSYMTCLLHVTANICWYSVCQAMLTADWKERGNPSGSTNNFSDENNEVTASVTSGRNPEIITKKQRINLRRSLASSSSTTSWRYSGGVRLTTLCIVRRMADGASLQNTITTLAVGSCFGYWMALQLNTHRHQTQLIHNSTENAFD